MADLISSVDALFSYFGGVLFVLGMLCCLVPRTFRFGVITMLIADVPLALAVAFPRRVIEELQKLGLSPEDFPDVQTGHTWGIAGGVATFIVLFVIRTVLVSMFKKPEVKEQPEPEELDMDDAPVELGDDDPDLGNALTNDLSAREPVATGKKGKKSWQSASARHLNSDDNPLNLEDAVVDLDNLKKNNSGDGLSPDLGSGSGIEEDPHGRFSLSDIKKAQAGVDDAQKEPTLGPDAFKNHMGHDEPSFSNAFIDNAALGTSNHPYSTSIAAHSSTAQTPAGPAAASGSAGAAGSGSAAPAGSAGASDRGADRATARNGLASADKAAAAAPSGADKSSKDQAGSSKGGPADAAWANAAEPGGAGKGKSSSWSSLLSKINQAHKEPPQAGSDKVQAPGSRLKSSVPYAAMDDEEELSDDVSRALDDRYASLDGDEDFNSYSGKKPRRSGAAGGAAGSAGSNSVSDLTTSGRISIDDVSLAGNKVGDLLGAIDSDGKSGDEAEASLLSKLKERDARNSGSKNSDSKFSFADVLNSAQQRQNDIENGEDEIGDEEEQQAFAALGRSHKTVAEALADLEAQEDAPGSPGAAAGDMRTPADDYPPAATMDEWNAGTIAQEHGLPLPVNSNISYLYGSAAAGHGHPGTVYGHDDITSGFDSLKGLSPDGNARGQNGSGMKATSGFGWKNEPEGAPGVYDNNVTDYSFSMSGTFKEKSQLSVAGFVDRSSYLGQSEYEADFHENELTDMIAREEGRPAPNAPSPSGRYGAQPGLAFAREASWQSGSAASRDDLLQSAPGTPLNREQVLEMARQVAQQITAELDEEVNKQENRKLGRRAQKATDEAQAFLEALARESLRGIIRNDPSPDAAVLGGLSDSEYSAAIDQQSYSSGPDYNAGTHYRSGAASSAAQTSPAAAGAAAGGGRAARPAAGAPAQDAPAGRKPANAQTGAAGRGRASGSAAAARGASGGRSAPASGGRAASGAGAQAGTAARNRARTAAANGSASASDFALKDHITDAAQDEARALAGIFGSDKGASGAAGSSGTNGTAGRSGSKVLSESESIEIKSGDGAQSPEIKRAGDQELIIHKAHELDALTLKKKKEGVPEANVGKVVRTADAGNDLEKSASRSLKVSGNAPAGELKGLTSASAAASAAKAGRPASASGTAASARASGTAAPARSSSTVAPGGTAAPAGSQGARASGTASAAGAAPAGAAAQSSAGSMAERMAAVKAAAAARKAAGKEEAVQSVAQRLEKNSDRELPTRSAARVNMLKNRALNARVESAEKMQDRKVASYMAHNQAKRAQKVADEAALAAAAGAAGAAAATAESPAGAAAGAAAGDNSIARARLGIAALKSKMAARAASGPQETAQPGKSGTAAVSDAGKSAAQAAAAASDAAARAAAEDEKISASARFDALKNRLSLVSQEPEKAVAQAVRALTSKVSVLSPEEKSSTAAAVSVAATVERGAAAADKAAPAAAQAATPAAAAQADAPSGEAVKEAVPTAPAAPAAAPVAEKEQGTARASLKHRRRSRSEAEPASAAAAADSAKAAATGGEGARQPGTLRRSLASRRRPGK